MARAWRVIRFGLCAVTAHVLVAPAARAQAASLAVAPARPARSSVSGLVRDPDGRPVAGAVVRFEAARRGAVSGEDGRFAIVGLPAGALAGTVRRLGFLPGDFVLELPPAVDVQVEVRVAPSPTRLPTVEVNGERRDFLLYANGFYERARAANGVFLGPAFLDARPGVPLHTILREVPRVRVACDPAGLRCDAVLGRPGASCAPRVWVDGFVAPAGALDEIVPRDRVRGVEVYSSAPFVPGEFVRPGDRCGAIAVWTELAPSWSRYLPRQVVRVPAPPPPAPSTPAAAPTGGPADRTP